MHLDDCEGMMNIRKKEHKYKNMYFGSVKTSKDEVILFARNFSTVRKFISPFTPY